MNWIKIFALGDSLPLGKWGHLRYGVLFIYINKYVILNYYWSNINNMEEEKKLSEVEATPEMEVSETEGTEEKKENEENEKEV